MFAPRGWAKRFILKVALLDHSGCAHESEIDFTADAFKVPFSFKDDFSNKLGGWPWEAS